MEGTLWLGYKVLANGLQSGNSENHFTWVTIADISLLVCHEKDLFQETHRILWKVASICQQFHWHFMESLKI